MDPNTNFLCKRLKNIKVWVSQQSINPGNLTAPTFDVRDLDLRLLEPQQSPIMDNVQMWQLLGSSTAMGRQAEGIIRVSAMHVSNKITLIYL